MSMEGGANGIPGYWKLRPNGSMGDEDVSLARSEQPRGLKYQPVGQCVDRGAELSASRAMFGLGHGIIGM